MTNQYYTDFGKMIKFLLVIGLTATFVAPRPNEELGGKEKQQIMKMMKDCTEKTKYPQEEVGKMFTNVTENLFCANDASKQWSHCWLGSLYEWAMDNEEKHKDEDKKQKDIVEKCFKGKMEMPSEEESCHALYCVVTNSTKPE